MRSTLSSQDWKNYLIRLYFGSGKDDLSACIGRAYLDFNRTLHGIDTYPQKDDLHRLATNQMRSSLSELKAEYSKPKTQEAFDRWHKSTCTKLKSIYSS